MAKNVNLWELGDTIGYVVVEYNQASHRPSLTPYTDLHEDIGDAVTERDAQRSRNVGTGRRERYEIAAIVLPDRDDDG